MRDFAVNVRPFEKNIRDLDRATYILVDGRDEVIDKYFPMSSNSNYASPDMWKLVSSAKKNVLFIFDQLLQSISSLNLSQFRKFFIKNTDAGVG